MAYETTSELPRPRLRGRQFDVVLFGATGFTGKLVAEYLVRNYAASDVRLALAGRSREKLAAVRGALAGIDPRAAGLELLIADSDDAASLEAVARRAEVVCTTVGPYARHGSKLVEACVKHGTDYCDLTGETHWIRRMIDAHHAEATRTGARIVNCCGFDSIPSDLGTLLLQEHAMSRYGAPCQEVKLFVTQATGGFSGGTIASMLNIFEEAGRDKAVRRVLGDPYALNPEGERQGPDGQDQRGLGRDPDLPGFTAPFVMAAVNTRIVRRCNALLGYRYGRDFRYSEAMGFPANARGLLMATGLTVGLTGFGAAMILPPTRALLERRVLPKPGTGPDEAARKRGKFTIRFVGKGEHAGQQYVVRARVKGTSDPGYGETAKMLSEAALCLALDGAGLSAPGGMLTPASCMGMRLVERLRSAGMTFEIE
jgi:short subunit dehydrogenase-like uncharacterized protein